MNTPQYTFNEPDIEKFDVLNDSGATLVKGTVIIFKTSGVASAYIGKKVDTTTILGDIRVAGVLMQTLKNGEHGECLKRGYCDYALTGGENITANRKVGASATAGKVADVTPGASVKELGWAVASSNSPDAASIYVDC